jgi:hypothetical protein
MLGLTTFRGTLSLCGPELQEHIDKLSPKSQVDVCFSQSCYECGIDNVFQVPHITVLAKHEVQKIGLDLNSQIHISQDSLQVLSVGNVKDVEFLTVSWAHAQLYRKKLGLEPKDFHITLTKIDIHDVRKDFTTTKGGYPVFVKIFQELPEAAMDYILADLLTTAWQQELCLEFLAKFPSYRALIRLADHTQGKEQGSQNSNPLANPHILLL